MGYCTVLGPIRAFDSTGEERFLAGEAQRRLLALLCFHAPSPVRPIALEEHMGVSAGAVRTSISRLRHVIGTDALVTGPAGYELRTDTDVVEFERLIAEAHPSDDDQARRDLERARSLWRGPPYEEFAHEQWAEVEVQRLNELHAAATEELVVLLLDAGECSAAIDALVPLIDAHRFRDLPRGLLMRALCETGRTTEALREFQTYRTELGEEVGTAPSAALVELDRAIASGLDPESLRRRRHPAWVRRRGSVASGRTRHSDLPTPLSSFVGRGRETLEVAALIRTHRIVTLTGAGGSGKSRLALHVASTAVDRATDTWWIDLGAVTASRDVAEHIATEIGVVPQLDPASEIVRRLQGRRSLLVLDNAEHVIDAVATVLADVMSRCPSGQALVTSREPMRMTGEVVWRVPALALPGEADRVTFDSLPRYDALQLFLARGREARPGMALDRAGVDHVVAICRELEGMPLALELAAARLRTLPLAAVAESINDIVRWTGDGPCNQVAHHATLRASIEWSVGLIDRREHDLLVAVSTFRSPFDIEAARAVAPTGIACDDIAPSIEHLTDIGLLQLDDDSGRYRMLNTVRQFCAEETDRARAERAHARFFAEWCDEVGAGRRGIEHRPFVLRMPDVVAATRWARSHDPSTAFRLCRGLAPVRSALGHSADFEDTWRWLMSLDDTAHGSSWAEAVAGFLPTASSRCLDTSTAEQRVAAHADASPRARSWLERGRAMIPAYRGRPERIRSYVDGLLSGEKDLEASVYVGFAAYILALMGRFDECDPLLDELRRMTRRHRTTFGVDSVGNGYAAAIVSDTARGDLVLALERGRRPVPKDPAFSITSAAALAHASLLAGDRDAMARALRWAEQGSFPLLGYLTPFTSCCAALLDERPIDAADLAEEFWERSEMVPIWRLYALPTINRALIDVGRAEVAERMTSIATELLSEMASSPLLDASLRLAHGQLALTRDDWDAAERDALIVRDRADTDGLPLATVDAIELFSAVSDRRGRHHAAVSARSASAVERGRLGYRFGIVPSRLTAVRPLRRRHGILASSERSTWPSMNSPLAPA